MQDTDRQPDNVDEKNSGDNRPEIETRGTGGRHRTLARFGRGWLAARSFDVNDVVEPMKPVGEPIRQAVLRNILVEFGRGAQPTCGLQPG